MAVTGSSSLKFGGRQPMVSSKVYFDEVAMLTASTATKVLSPAEERGAENRRYLRVPIDLAVRYRPSHIDQWVKGRATNISVGGLFITAEVLPAIGTEVAFEVYQNEELVLRGKGDVRWHRPDGSANTLQRGFGIQFDVLDKAAHARVLEIVDAYLSTATPVLKPAGVRAEPSAPASRWKAAAIVSIASVIVLLVWMVVRS